MTRCQNHRKEFLGNCMWCGKKLCEICIAKQEGRKFYCEPCTAILNPIKREKLPTAQENIPQAPAQEQPTVKKRFVPGTDGYFELR